MHKSVLGPQITPAKAGGPRMTTGIVIPAPFPPSILAALSPTQTPVRFRCWVPEVAAEPLSHRKKGTEEGSAFLRTVPFCGWMPGQEPAD